MAGNLTGAGTQIWRKCDRYRQGDLSKKITVNPERRILLSRTPSHVVTNEKMRSLVK